MKSLLKVIVCSLGGDGISTLIEAISSETGIFFEDQEKALEFERKFISCKGKIDYSSLLDELMGERNLRVTGDVAYSYFVTDNRSFIFADCQHHEQYAKNIAVGALFADIAVISIDVTQGVLSQTKRDLRICSLMGIKHFILAVDRMELIDYERYRFDEIKQDILNFTAHFNLDSMQIIPISAIDGGNVTRHCIHMPWYDGLPLLSYLDGIDINLNVNHDEFILPVQRIYRSNHTFGELQGQIESGSIFVGQEIVTLPSHEKVNVKSISILNQEIHEASRGQTVTIVLDKEVDLSRVCILAKDTTLELADMFTATIFWMDDTELVAGRNYLVKIGAKIIPAMVMAIKFKIDINTGKHIAADMLSKNEIASCDIVLSEKFVFYKCGNNKVLGGLNIIDKVTDTITACGVVEHSLRRSTNVVWQNTDITREIRSKQKGQKPFTLWYTGLSGSGKSTLANEVEKRLVAMGKHTMLLDGDNIRHGLNKNLGFKEADRVENIRRIAEVAKLMNDAGIITITSFISPYESDRKHAKEIIGEEYIEIFVSTPLEECEKRDVKGLYKKARVGEIPQFTGISSPYEKPISPNIEIDTSKYSIKEATDILMKQILKLME